MTPKDKVRLACKWTAKHHPATFGGVLANWKIIADDRCLTASTDGDSLFYSPKYFNDKSLGIIKCIVMHEAAHCWLGHLRLHPRFPQNRMIANLGKDLEVNWKLSNEYREALGEQNMEDLENIGCFPGRGQYADLPPGKSAEWYIARLTRRAGKKKDSLTGARRHPENLLS